jgi:hypothetical protein
MRLPLIGHRAQAGKGDGKDFSSFAATAAVRSAVLDKEPIRFCALSAEAEGSFRSLQLTHWLFLKSSSGFLLMLWFHEICQRNHGICIVNDLVVDKQSLLSQSRFDRSSVSFLCYQKLVKDFFLGQELSLECLCHHGRRKRPQQPLVVVVRIAVALPPTFAEESWTVPRPEKQEEDAHFCPHDWSDVLKDLAIEPRVHQKEFPA